MTRKLGPLIRLKPRANTLYISQNRTVLAMDTDGFISKDQNQQGLFVYQTRLLSHFRYSADSSTIQPVAQSNVDQHSWLGYYIIPSPKQPQAEPSQESIELRISRFIGDGFHEDIDLTNFTQEPVQFTLFLDVDSDFADEKEAQGQRKQKGKIQKHWKNHKKGKWELCTDYSIQQSFEHQNEKGTAQFDCGLSIQIENAGSAPKYEKGRISFPIKLAPRGHWHACLNFIASRFGKSLPLLYRCRSFIQVDNEFDYRRKSFLNGAAILDSAESNRLSHVVTGAFEQAKYDLAALRLYDLDHHEKAWTMSAGLPIYIALFGRDTLTTAWQAGLASSEMMEGTLKTLADSQGKEDNAWRDERLGRMLHQADSGPLAVLNINPLGRYYGSITTSALYPFFLAEYWHWTGDKEKVALYLDHAMAALKWLDDYADMDKDGFYEYKTCSTQGVKNQAWKDSEDAIVYEDGAPVKAPIATCEEQGFVYIAKLHVSEVLWWLGRKDEAKRLYQEASELKKRFNEAFWMEDEGFFALGLDSEKKQIRSITSNVGHCIATSIIDQSLVPRTVGRLFADDMFTGWGIRTLSSSHPAYNPYSYHRGTVWPVEHGTFALGFYRYGLHQHVEMISRAQFEAASLFDFYRLPECFAGHSRDIDHPFPAIYPKANSPQAWSSSAVLCLVQAILGLYPFAPLHMLLVDPHLPEWLPEVTLKNLHIGKAVCNIRFYRKSHGESDYQVLNAEGPLHVVRQPSPWSLTAGYAERIEDVLYSFLPGK